MNRHDAKSHYRVVRSAFGSPNGIKKASGHAMRVQPVVALPGWFVKEKGFGAVKVISGRQLSGLLERQGQLGDATPVVHEASQIVHMHPLHHQDQHAVLLVVQAATDPQKPRRRIVCGALSISARTLRASPREALAAALQRRHGADTSSAGS